MSTLSELTRQENRILELVARGWRNSTIAHELFISPRTVETHLYHIFDKLDVATRTEAAMYVLRGNSFPNRQTQGVSEDRADKKATDEFSNLEHWPKRY